MNRTSKILISILGLTTVGASAFSIDLVLRNSMLDKQNKLIGFENRKINNEMTAINQQSEQLLKKLEESNQWNQYFIELFNQVNGSTYEELKSIPRINGSAFPFSDLHKEMLKLGIPSSENIWFYESYITSANYERKVPNWVMQSITIDQMKKKVADRQGVYFNNKTIQVPDKFRANNKDYQGSGWSRGHMVPAGDNIHSQEAMNQTFLLNANIVPQDLNNNQNFWYRLESFCKSEMVNRYKKVTIISGPVYQPNLVEILTEEQLNNRVRYSRQTEKKYVKYEVIGENNVAVPNYLFKVILAEPKDDINGEDNNNQQSKQPYLLGSFLIPNEPIPHNAVLLDYEVPLHEIEVKTGLQFFKKLNFKNDIKPLCEDPSNCVIMTEKMLLPRLIGFCRSKRDIDSLIRENGHIEWDDGLNKMIQDKIIEIKKEEELKKNNNNQLN